MIDLRQVTLLRKDVRNVHIQNYKIDGGEKYASQLVIDLQTEHLEDREVIRIPLSREQQKHLYKALKKALNK